MIATKCRYKYLQHFETETRVKAPLLNMDAFRVDQVSVIAFCGVIELYGTVFRFYDKNIAIGIDERVFGVNTVVESIQIRQPRNSVLSQIEGTSETRRFRSS